MKDPIEQIGSLVLRQKAKPILKKDINSRAIKSLIAKMKKSLDKEKYGVAIAAPQVGASLRLFVVAGRAFDEESADAGNASRLLRDAG